MHADTTAALAEMIKHEQGNGYITVIIVGCVILGLLMIVAAGLLPRR